MLYSYNKYKLILEDNSKNKIEQKIRKFLNVDFIINYIFNTIIKDNGLKYAVWFANQIKINFGEYISSEDNYSKDDIDHYLKTGEIIYTDVNKNKINKSRILTLWRWWTDDLYWIEIKDWLISPLRTEKVDLSKLTLKDAIEKSEEWHDSLKATGIVTNEKGTIIMTFDDGYYWIDLETDYCEDEAEAMGHCASTDSDTLLSLRNNKSPHVTVALDYGDGKYENGKIKTYGSIGQIKGRNNKKPKEKYHKYIVELLCFPNVNIIIPKSLSIDKYKIDRITHDEYKPEEDFHITDLKPEQILSIMKRNKKFKFSLNEKYKLYKEDYITKEDLIKGYKDLIIKNDEIYFVLYGWKSLNSLCFDTDEYLNPYDVLIEVENNNIIGEANQNSIITFNYDKYWTYFTDETLKKIKNFIIKNKIDISYYLEEDDNYPHDIHDIVLNDKNMKIEHGDIVITLFENVKFNLSDLLNNTSYDYSFKNLKYGEIFVNEHDLDNLRDELNYAFNSSKIIADKEEAYPLIVKEIEVFLGKIVSDKENSYHSKDGKIYFKLDFENISNLNFNIDTDSFLKILNNHEYDYYDEQHMIEYKKPENGYKGKIDKETLNNEISNYLSLN